MIPTPPSPAIARPVWTLRTDTNPPLLQRADGGRVAAICDANALSDSPDALRASRVAAPAVVVRTGWPEGAEEPAWFPRHRERAAEFLDHAAERGPLWITPRVGDVYSDIPSTLSFLRGRSPARFGLVLEPARLLSEAMVENAADHLDRIFEAFGSSAFLLAVVIPNHVAPGIAAMIEQRVHGLTASIAEIRGSL